MFNFFKILFRIGIIIALLSCTFCYANKRNQPSKIFDRCTKVTGNKYQCKLNVTTDLAKIKGYSCQGDTCTFYSAPMSLSTQGKENSMYGFNNMPYALCSMSKCTIDKKNSKMAICDCPIINTKDDISSLSIGMYNRKKSLPVYDVNGNMVKVTSNFSMINVFDFKNKLKTNKDITVCKYNKNQLYTDCFGVICEVDKQNALNAICRCPIKKNKSFVSVSGKCKTSPNEVYCAVDTEQYQNSVSSILYRHFERMQ